MGEKAKRYRSPIARPGELKAQFGRNPDDGTTDILYVWGGAGAARADARVLSSAFEEVEVFGGKSLRQVLDERGYDIASMRFSIQQRVSEGDR